MPTTRSKAAALGVALLTWLVLGALLNSVVLAHAASPVGRLWIWIITLGLSVAAVVTIGQALCGHPMGLVIDNRNMMSLSRLQMLLWTLVVIPTLVTAAASNVIGIGNATLADPLGITIPTELLAALGLAGVSFAGTPVILNTKTGSTPHQDELRSTTSQLNMTLDQVSTNGKVFGKASMDEASWADMFRGEEVGNADTPDLGKIQQFFVTVLLIGIYLAAIASEFKGDDAIQQLPNLSQQFIWLLAVSHGTDLAYKAVPHTKDADGQTDNSAAAAQGGGKPAAKPWPGPAPSRP